jgi:hypothetical protein
MEQRYVGIDLHRRRSVIYTMDGEGRKLSCVRIANEPATLFEAVAPAGEQAHVVVEATYGWYWAVDLLRDNGCRNQRSVKAVSIHSRAGGHRQAPLPVTGNCAYSALGRRPAQECASSQGAGLLRHPTSGVDHASRRW